MELSLNKKRFFEFFFWIFEIEIQFWTFPKKMTLLATWLFDFKNIVFTVFLNLKYKTRQSSLCWFSFISKYIISSLLATF